MQATNDLAQFYLNLINGIRTRSYEMNTRSILLYLTETGAIKPDIISNTFHNFQEFGAYLENVTYYLNIFDPLDRYLMVPKPTIAKY